jgi:hypothetical protein
MSLLITRHGSNQSLQQHFASYDADYCDTNRHRMLTAVRREHARDDQRCKEPKAASQSHRCRLITNATLRVPHPSASDALGYAIRADDSGMSGRLIGVQKSQAVLMAYSALWQPSASWTHDDEGWRR